MCDTLVKCNFNVTLIGRELNNSRPIERPYSTKRLRLFFNKGFLFYFEYNLRLFFLLMFKKFDVYHANDLDTLLPMWIISSVRRKNLVYDTHEYFTGVPEIQNRFIVKKVWKAIEKLIFPRLNHVFTVNSSIANLYFDDYQINPKILRNLPSIIAIQKIKSRSELGLPIDKSIVILQGSGINIHRGSEELVEAIATQEKFFLCIVGTGDVIENLKTRCNDDDLKSKVLFIDPLPYQMMMQYTLNSDVGVSLDKNNNINYQFSLPNKIFDYSKAEIPYVSTNLAEIKKIVDEFHTGVLINSLKPEDILNGLEKAIDLSKSDSYLRNIKKMNSDLNWEKESKVLIATYKSFK